ncbi:MAG TPA: VOC family protein [Steroidobacteraceae bacterium]|nr:VOC family protein [Steroidobacteraceae bacterium]
MRSALYRIWLTALLAFAALSTTVGHTASPTEASAAPVRSVDSVGITVSDMERSLEFYTRVLSFEHVGGREVAGDAYDRLYGVSGLRLRIERLRLGEEHVELMQFLAPRGRPIPADSRSHDRWFQHVAIIVSDMDRAYAVLREHGVEHASIAPQRLPDWNPNAGGIEAFYFRDPDGNHLEILRFPPGKGEARWQQDGRLFLGIDHTAIVVGDTDTSLRFYRDALGLRVAGASENFGIEQERLNNVAGAHLRITALRAASGPGIEFLEYLAPRTGRPMPADTLPNDLWHWQVNTTADVEAARARLAGARPGSDGTQATLPDEHTTAQLVRDPDGHALLLQQPPSASN